MNLKDLRPKNYTEVLGQDGVKNALKTISKNPKYFPKSIIIHGEYGLGKCVPGFVRVDCEEGYVKFSRFNKEIELKNSEEEYYKDYTIKLSNIKDEYKTSKIYFKKNCICSFFEDSDGFFYYGTPEHSIVCFNKILNEFEYIKIDDIKIGDCICHPLEIKRSVKKTDLENINLFLMFLGAFFVSGEIIKNDYKYTIRIRSDSLNIISSFNKIFGYFKKNYINIKTYYLEYYYNEMGKFFDFEQENLYEAIIDYVLSFENELIWYFVYGIFLFSRIHILDDCILLDSNMNFDKSYLLFDVFHILGLYPRLERNYDYGSEGSLIGIRYFYKFKTLFVKKIIEEFNKIDIYKFKFLNQKYECNDLIFITSEFLEKRGLKEVLKEYNYNKGYIRREKLIGYYDKLFIEDTNGYGRVNILDFYYSVVYRKRDRCLKLDVYDFTVPEIKSFYAQGVMNHNTTLSRIFSKSVNCKDFKEDLCNECEVCKEETDIKPYYFEYNCSFINAETIRQISNQLMTYELSRYKYIVYCFDEFQVINKSVQEDFLKIFEDCKVNAFFLITTTELNKIIQTIHSRSILLQVNKCDTRYLYEYLINLIKKYKPEYEITEEVKKVINDIILYSNGHIRDAVKMLCSYFSFENKEMFKELIKVPELDILNLFLNIDKEEFFKYIENIYNYNRVILVNTIFSVIEKLIKVKVGYNFYSPYISLYKEVSNKYSNEIFEIFKFFNQPYCQNVYNEYSKIISLLILFKEVFSKKSKVENNMNLSFFKKR